MAMAGNTQSQNRARSGQCADADGHLFFNTRGLRAWQLAEEHGLALERQAEEHHRSEAEQNHSEGLRARTLSNSQEKTRATLVSVATAAVVLAPAQTRKAILHTRPSTLEPDECSLTLTQVSEQA